MAAPHRRLRRHRLHRPPDGRAARRPGRRAGARRALRGRRCASWPSGSGSSGGWPTRCARTPCSRCSSPATCWSAPSGRSSSGASRPCGRRSRPSGVYIDSTGEPPFIRRVFEEFGPPAERAGRDAADRDGLRLRAGRAGGRRWRWRRRATRPCASTSATTRSAPGSAPGTRRSAVGDHARRRLRVPRRRAADGAARRARALVPRRAARTATAISVGGAEHFTLPAALPAAARGQRLPRLVRRRSRGRCRRAAWRARWRCACPACAAR